MRRVLNNKFVSQKRKQLLTETVKPIVPWQCFSLDSFGTFLVKRGVNKFTKRKIYGLTFNCLTNRAVCMDIVIDYSTEGFLITLWQIFYQEDF